MHKLPHFQFSHKDHWGREYVLCPICEFPYEKNVVMRHITKQCNKGEKAHCAWKQKHTYTHPTN